MSARNLFLGLAVVVTVIVGGMGWHWRGERQALIVRQRELATQSATVIATLQRHRERLAAANRDVEARKAVLEKTRREATAAASKPPPPETQRYAPVLETIRDDPEAEALYLQSQRADLAAKYGPLFRNLGLRPEQV